MNFKETLVDMLARMGKMLVPDKFRSHIHNYLLKAGFDEVPYTAFGILFIVGGLISAGLFSTLLWKHIENLNAFLAGLLTFILFVVILFALTFFVGTMAYFYLNLKIYQRTKDLEDRLPDYLSLVSTNLKGGLSFEKSLWAGIKPEFGILAKEITIVSKKVLTGNDVIDALDEFSTKYNSPILRRSMNLISGEIETGGRIVDVIDRVIENLRKTKNLKEEMAAATVSYMLFIGVIVIAIAPGLFALAYQLLHIIIGFTGTMASTASGVSSGFMGGGGIGQSQIDPADFRTFSLIALALVAVFSSFIISIIERGDVRGGFRYTLAFVIGSVLFYVLFQKLLEKMFSGLAF